MTGLIQLAMPLLLTAYLAGALWMMLVTRSVRPSRAPAIVACSSAMVLATLVLVASTRGWAASHHALMLGPFLADRLSAPLLWLLSVCAWAVVVAAPKGWAEPHRLTRVLVAAGLYSALLLVRDVASLAALWAASAVPGWLSLRENPDARVAARTYAIYMAASALTFAGALVSVAVRASVWQIHTLTLAHQPESAWVMGALVLGIIIRQGLFPFHSWLPVALEHKVPGPALLYFGPCAGIYALERLEAPLFPESNGQALSVLAGLALFSAVYTAGLALVQRDFRRTLAMLVLSQSALAFVGVECASSIGVTGGLALVISQGVSLTGLALAGWALEARRGRLRLDRYQGHGSRATLMASLFLVCGLSAVGLPGTIGFISEDLLMHGVLEGLPRIGSLVVLATALAAVAVLRAFVRLFQGPPTVTFLQDLLPREQLSIGFLVALLFAGGLWPAAWVSALTAGWTHAVHPELALDDSSGRALGEPPTGHLELSQNGMGSRVAEERSETRTFAHSEEQTR